MLALIIITLSTAISAEIHETDGIWNNDEYAIALARVEVAKKRVEDAKKSVMDKGERKAARLQQAIVSRVEAERKLTNFARGGSRKYQFAALMIAYLTHKYYAGTPGIRLPFALPTFLSAFMGCGDDDARNVNAFSAACVLLYVFRGIAGDVLGRGARHIDAYWSQKDTERFLTAQKRTFANMKKDAN